MFLLADVVGTAIGGEMVTTTEERRKRYGVTVRYPRELRSDLQAHHRHGFRSDEPHRSTDGRRRVLQQGVDAGGDSGDLCAGETVAVEAGAGGVIALGYRRKFELLFHSF